jgi:methionine sulfoxide reductase heme-binding subunit
MRLPGLAAWVWAVAMLPGVYWWWAALTDRLGVNPAEALIRGLGLSTLQLLCVVLLITPLRVSTGWTGLARWRRPLGLAVFAHALLHALAYAWLDQAWDASALVLDVLERPFITVGMVATLLLLAMALTSWNGIIRAMGARRWQALHRSVYLVAVLAVLHFYWMRMGKNHFGEVWFYGLALMALLGWRVWRWQRQRRISS